MGEDDGQTMGRRKQDITNALTYIRLNMLKAAKIFFIKKGDTLFAKYMISEEFNGKSTCSFLVHISAKLIL